MLATKTKFLAQEDGGRRLVIPLTHHSKNLGTQMMEKEKVELF